MMRWEGGEEEEKGIDGCNEMEKREEILEEKKIRKEKWEMGERRLGTTEQR